MKKKILLICNTSQNIYTFRLPLIKKLIEEGYEVSTITFDNAYAEDLRNEDIKLYYINDKNRSINPLNVLTLKNKYYKLIKKINPDIVFTFQLKPNIFGVKAAKKAGVKNIFSMVEGAGDTFINKSLKWKFIKFVEINLYKSSLKSVKKVFFLNNDDKSEFEKLKIARPEQSIVVKGIGVDLNKFAFKPVNKKSNKFIMIARMLKTKGVFEYCKCARLVKQSHPEAEFMYLGGEGSVKVCDIQEYIDDGSVNYLGTTKDVRPYIEDSLALVLPSYREGIPMVVMEAESIGRSIIISNRIGCKETVEDGFNGYLVKQEDYETMAQKCIEILENKDLAVTLGKNSRRFAEENFDEKKINSTIYEIITKESI